MTNKFQNMLHKGIQQVLPPLKPEYSWKISENERENARIYPYVLSLIEVKNETWLCGYEFTYLNPIQVYIVSRCIVQDIKKRNVKPFIKSKDNHSKLKNKHYALGYYKTISK